MIIRFEGVEFGLVEYIEDIDMIKPLMIIERFYDRVLDLMNDVDNVDSLRLLREIELDRIDLHDVCQEVFVINYLYFVVRGEDVSNLTKPSYKSFLRCFVRLDSVDYVGFVDGLDDNLYLIEFISGMLIKLRDVEWYSILGSSR